MKKPRAHLRHHKQCRGRVEGEAVSVMRELLVNLLEDVEFDPERLLDWVDRHRGALLWATALLAALVLLAPGPVETSETPQLDLAPDDTPLFV